MFLVHEALEGLGSISKDVFPRLVMEEGNIAELTDEEKKSCRCPKRRLPPEKPTKILFIPIEENIGKLKDWLGEHF